MSGCREGNDPADFGSGSGDDSSDPVASQLYIFDKRVVNSSDPDDPVPDLPPATTITAHVLVGVTNINFASDITFNWATADGTGTSGGASPHYKAVVGANAVIPAGYAQVILSVPLYRKNNTGVNFTGTKTFTITISGAVNGTIVDATATVTIDYDNIDPNATNPGLGSGLSIIQTNGAAGVSEGSPAVFNVILNPASGGTVTVNYATANGTATAPADYTSKSGTLTFNAGDTVKTISVATVADTVVEGVSETFVVNLSAPSGAALVNSQATAYIVDSTPVGLPDAFTGWADGQRVTYDEFHAGGGGGCRWKTACTGFAGAACASGLASFQGKGRWRFNPRRLYTDAGCPDCFSGGVCDPTACGSGCNPARVPNWLNGSGHTIQRIDKAANDLGTSSTRYSCLERQITVDLNEYTINTVSIAASSHQDLVSKLKQAIHNNGVVYMASIFYDGWNVCRGSYNSGANNDGHILRPFTGNSAKAHAWCLFGWDDNVLVPSNAAPEFGSTRGQRVGCFRIQSSHGCDWGVDGRGWIPYSVLGTPTGFSGTAPRWKYWKFMWVG